MSERIKCQECGTDMVYRNGGVPGVDTPPMNDNLSGRDRTLVCLSVHSSGDHDWDTLAQEASFYHEHGQVHPSDHDSSDHRYYGTCETCRRPTHCRDCGSDLTPHTGTYCEKCGEPI